MKVLVATAVMMLMLLASSQPFVKGERSLRNQLMDFKTLIPRSKLGYIVNKHYSRDSQFRHVMQYINTPEFDKVVQMVQHSSAYQQIIKYLQDAGVNTSSFENISENIEALLSQFPDSAEAGTKEHNEQMYEETPFYFDDESSEEVSSYYFPGVSARSVQTFSNEIANSIPRKAFREMVEEKMEVNEEFAKFYSAVTSKDFRRVIVNAMVNIYKILIWLS